MSPRKFTFAFPISTESILLKCFFLFSFVHFLSLNLIGDTGNVIICSVEGEVSSFSIEDEFRVTLDVSSVGKKLEEKSIVETGDNGTASILFSNGTLITINPGSRFYLRKFAQKAFEKDHNLKPSELEEEPSLSELLCHLDFGNLVVKAPKLNKGSSMNISSPLGTAGIRGTMFQLVAVRNPVTGDITGGVNLISGDISYTDVGGNLVELVSGQSLQLASGKLGDSMATMPGGLVDLSSIYSNSLIGNSVPPAFDVLFPQISDSQDDEDVDSIGFGNLLTIDTDWEIVHEISSEIFFTIEFSEISAQSFSFDDIADAVSVTTPSPQIQAPSVPVSVVSDVIQTVEGIENLYIKAPTITLVPGANQVSNDPYVIEYLVKRKNLNYPLDDYGPFKILSVKSSIYPSYSAVTMGDIDISNAVVISNLDSVDYTQLGHESTISLYVDDFEQRKVNFADGRPVSVTIKPVVKIVDSQKPIISFTDGNEKENPLKISGGIGLSFSDPGVSLIDNFYTEQEILNFNGLEQGAEQSVFGKVNMEIAGLYEITYQGISDPSGNFNDPKTRWVQVVDSNPPEITLYGSDPIYMDLNTTNIFKDPGVFGMDNLDGTIEWGDSRIDVFVEMLVDDVTESYSTVSNSLESIIEKAKKEDSVNATFRLKYIISDLAGNQAQAFRQIVLINSPFKTPVMVLHGDSPLYHEVNTPFSDPGVTAYKDMGIGISPINLNDRVSSLAYIGDIIQGLDSSLVNYHFKNGYYVDSTGNQDPTKKVVIKYVVTDQFGHEARLEREVRIVDRTPPAISLNDGGGIDFLNIQAGASFSDPGASVTDNYDANPLIITKLQLGPSMGDVVDPSGGEIFNTLSTIGFWEPGDYQISHTSTDSNDNVGENNRTIRVVDTIAPLISVIPHSFLTSPSTNSLNSDAPVISSVINYPNNPIPTEILNEISSLAGYNHITKTYVQIDADPYINTFGSDKDFYIKDLPNDPNDVNFDDTISGQTTKLVNDVWGRSFIWYSAFKINFGNGVTLQDPGVYIRNDSNLGITVTSSVNKTTDTDGRPFKYFISYTATQANGQTATVSNARTIRFIDAVAPTIDLSPSTDGTDTFILAEGGVDYGDTSTSAYLWTNSTSSKSGSFTLETKVLDAAEGSIPHKLVRTIYSNYVNAGTFTGSIYYEGNVTSANPITDVPKSDLEISQAVSDLIPTDFSKKDQIYTIKYDARDTANNIATSNYRYVVVKDTMPPTITSPANQTLIVDYTSSSNPNVMDEQSVKDYMVADINVTDANNFEPVANLTWNVTIAKPNGASYDPGVPFPTSKDDPGYTVTISATDPSGNTSSSITRYLKVGDTQKPTLTMMGKSVIHDFLRFASNTGPDAPSPATHVEEMNGTLHDATGFSGGEHKMLLAGYNFVDPGVYAEDNNSAWNVANNYPDLDGDGVGEGYAFIKVSDPNDVSLCSNGPNVIHVYSHFEAQSVSLNSKSMAEWQSLLESNTYGFPSNSTAVGSAAKVPKVWNSTTNNSSDHNFTDLDKESDASTLTNLDMTVVTINYRVKDGWDNFSDPMARTVYIYESAQYSGYAFYATPITDINGNAFEDYDNNGSTNNPSMSAARKDTDGDGVSDFWEFALNTDFKNPLDKPNLSTENTFINNPNLLIGNLGNNLSKINAANRLINDINITATQGL